MEIYENNPRKFIDKKSNFIFVHDEEFLFQEEYEALYYKYKRKINRFLENTAKPTCFLRAVMNYEELEYIENNAEYINKTIKKRNTNNEIIFLIKNSLKVKKLNFRFFIINREYSKQTTELMRSWFDTETQLLDFCANNFNTIDLMKNFYYDQKKNTNYPRKEFIYFTKKICHSIEIIGNRF